MKNKKLYPKCLNGKTSFVSASGQWLPCCWLLTVGPIFDNSIFSKNICSLKKNSLNDIIQSAPVKDFFKSLLDTPDEAPEQCHMYCSQTLIKKNGVTQTNNPNKDTIRYKID